MQPTVRGLAVTHSLVGTPTQWHLLLLLADGPQFGSRLRRQLPRLQRRQCGVGLWQLWRHHLIVFHVKQRTWALSTRGAGLRPVLAAILTCTQPCTQPTGGPTK